MDMGRIERITKRYLIGCSLLMAFPGTLLAQNIVETQLKWLTNPKGWAFSKSIEISVEHASKEANLYSPCVSSAIITFKADGTYTEVFAQKDCPDESIEDTK